MALGIFSSCSKCLLVLFNVLILLSGLALIIVGALQRLHIAGAANFATSFTAPPILSIVVGSIIFVVAFFGCWGAAVENRCMLITYAVLLCVVVAIEAVVAGWAFTVQAEHDTFTKAISDAFSHWGDTDAGGFTTRESFDELQHAFQCCGVNGLGDYPQFMSGQLNIVPASCCDYTSGINQCPSNYMYGDSKTTVQFDPAQCTADSDQTANNVNCRVFTRGCASYVTTVLQAVSIVIGSIAVGSAILTLLGVILSCCLACNV